MGEGEARVYTGIPAGSSVASARDHFDWQLRDASRAEYFNGGDLKIKLGVVVGDGNVDGKGNARGGLTLTEGVD